MGNLAFVRRRENSHARQTLAKMGMAFTAEKTKLASALTQKRATAIGRSIGDFRFLANLFTQIFYLLKFYSAIPRYLILQLKSGCTP